MNVNRFRAVSFLALVASAALQAQAAAIPDRPTLVGLLGGGGTLETFEALPILPGGQRSDGTLLNSTSIFDGAGPGLVQPGASYVANDLFWNGDGYYNLISQTLGDASFGRPMTIQYSVPVTAMGFDIQGYEGFSAEGLARVYDTANNLLGVALIDRGFFGWENSGGIGRVELETGSYILIDNHLFGVPSPAAAGLFGLGGLALTRRRR
jgi:hypothetical protein